MARNAGMRHPTTRLLIPTQSKIRIVWGTQDIAEIVCYGFVR